MKKDKFICRYENGKPYEWQRITRNPFTGSFIHYMLLTSVQNDRVLKKAFADVLKDDYDDVAYYDCDCRKLSWLKDFKGAKYTVASVNYKDFDRFDKVGFEMIGVDSDMPNNVIMIRKNF